ncbi:MAG: type II toxin-antitoxin system RelB/DinJ family antitoxin [Candidatus Sungbacteria bacterium]|nr:type II toxin-antitoxin system RelB/DinJ family antitoxin [Candidatus Sungbacteria bacterium]
MNTVINIKTKKEVKLRAQKVASELGLSLSAIINAYLRQLARAKEIHFSITPRMSLELERLIGKAEYDISREKNLSPRVSSHKELDAYFSAL